MVPQSQTRELSTVLYIIFASLTRYLLWWASLKYCIGLLFSYPSLYIIVMLSRFSFLSHQESVVCGCCFYGFLCQSLYVRLIYRHLTSMKKSTAKLITHNFLQKIFKQMRQNQYVFHQMQKILILRLPISRAQYKNSELIHKSLHNHNGQLKLRVCGFKILQQGFESL